MQSIDLFLRDNHLWIGYYYINIFYVLICWGVHYKSIGSLLQGIIATVIVAMAIFVTAFLVCESSSNEIQMIWFWNWFCEDDLFHWLLRCMFQFHCLCRMRSASSTIIDVVSFWYQSRSFVPFLHLRCISARLDDPWFGSLNVSILYEIYDPRLGKFLSPSSIVRRHHTNGMQCLKC